MNDLIYLLLRSFFPNLFRINLQISVEPLIPREPFDAISLKDFLLTKIYNAYMMGRSVPPINR
jgi:hypothetical protein